MKTKPIESNDQLACQVQSQAQQGGQELKASHTSPIHMATTAHLYFAPSSTLATIKSVQTTAEGQDIGVLLAGLLRQTGG